jgi:hypothetical protein
VYVCITCLDHADLPQVSLQRLNPGRDYDDNIVFSGWSKMATPLTSFRITQVRLDPGNALRLTLLLFLLLCVSIGGSCLPDGSGAAVRSVFRSLCTFLSTDAIHTPLFVSCRQVAILHNALFHAQQARIWFCFLCFVAALRHSVYYIADISSCMHACHAHMQVSALRVGEKHPALVLAEPPCTVAPHLTADISLCPCLLAVLCAGVSASCGREAPCLSAGRGGGRHARHARGRGQRLG